ncbi:alkaline phosphatase [Sphingosinicella sp. CPCC 101087]|uniref:alkaline phosphatase D family protein n=1 Tax=Sphingosinicella sp. CPCC 101087 TaxID=2497754 RepID=UPI00101C2F38|nr:alkaline phosphatase D family protein [Sphingosinicella sp. CPCC 101087]
MPVNLDRRLLLKAGTLGIGALAMPGGAVLLQGSGFTHNVASGEPRPDQVMLWTRYVPAPAASARLAYEVSPTRDFATVSAGGTVTADPERDWCVKPVAEGLDPGRTYFYRFVDAQGRFSPVGRTRTLPQGSVDRFKMGVFSCSNLPFGWFNAYAHAAGRDDLDLIVHLGDYLYEYQRGTYPSLPQALDGRVIEPAGEIVALADYRMRYAAYRADTDLQRLHQMFPMVMMWDDHENANDSWTGGAENHQPETEGDWQARKMAAMRACREWLPVSDRDWESYEIGDLATLFRLETRLTGRTRPLDLGAALAGREDLPAALVEFRDGPWRDARRTLLGAEQEAWLAQGLKGSTRRGARWQVIAQQVVMGSLSLPPEVAAFVANGASEEVRRRTAAGLAAAQAGLPFNLDMWDGYPAARDRLLRSAQEAEANLIVLSGDSHNAWAFQLEREGVPAGVDMAVQSVTSPGYETYVPQASPEDLARALIGGNPQLRWAEVSRRGYLTLELTPGQAIGEWQFLGTIRERSTATSGHALKVVNGTNRLERVG